MFEFYPIIPILILACGACALLAAGKLLHESRTTAWLTLFTLASALAAVFCMDVGGGPHQQQLIHLAHTHQAPLGFVFDPFAKIMSLAIVMAALLSAMGCFKSVEEEGIDRPAEFYFLCLMSVAGALLMVSARDFLTIFIGLEVASLALYALCAARIGKPASSEAGLKYFLMGCFSSAFFLYGIAMWYGATGSLLLSVPEHPQLTVYSSPLLGLSFLFILVGLGFKIGLAPFHLWVPDVYQGAPLSVTTFMSCVVKLAAFGALIRIVELSFGLPSEWTTKILWVLSVIAMVLGNLAALQQQSLRRMLAYSSVAQAGYMLMGLVALAQGPQAVASVVFYLIVYCAMSIGVFSVLSIIGPDTDSIDDVKGLGKRSPFLAVSMTFFFLALAGLPPSLAGLIGKVFLFSSSVAGGFSGLAIIAAINSAVACAYYFKAPFAMWFQRSAATPETPRMVVSPVAGFSLVFCVMVVIVLGLAPNSIYGAALHGVMSLRPH